MCTFVTLYNVLVSAVVVGRQSHVLQLIMCDFVWMQSVCRMLRRVQCALAAICSRLI